MSRKLIDYFVLDALADDLDATEDILRMLNSDALGWRDLHTHPFTRDEIVPVLARMIRDGLVEACIWSHRERALVPAGEGVIPDRNAEAWFTLTPLGRTTHRAWEPPSLSGPA